MDIQSLFITVYDCIRSKLSSEMLSQYINVQDEEGNTVLLYASFKGNIDVITTLISSGANVQIRNNMGLSVMHMAAQGDRPHLLIYFKDKYNLNICDKDYNGNTPLHWACHTTAENAINFLLYWMPNINIQDKKGQTPLHIAIHTSCSKIIKKLLFKGADIYIKDNNGQSVIKLLTENTQKLPEFENSLHLITDTKPMKLCFQNSKSKTTIFNSKMFIILHLLCETIIYFVLLPYVNFSLFNVIAFYVLISTLTIVFVCVYLSDPGQIKCNDNRTWLQLVEDKTFINDYCPYCKIQKTIRIKHCHLCGMCVDGFDHHCNWIDNCVGFNNLNLFFAFLVIVLVNLAYSYYIAFTAFLISNNNINNNMKDKGLHVFNFGFIVGFSSKDMMAVFVMSVCLCFFLPALYVLWIQINNRWISKKKVNRR